MLVMNSLATIGGFFVDFTVEFVRIVSGKLRLSCFVEFVGFVLGSILDCP